MGQPVAPAWGGLWGPHTWGGAAEGADLATGAGGRQAGSRGANQEDGLPGGPGGCRVGGPAVTGAKSPMRSKKQTQPCVLGAVHLYGAGWAGGTAPLTLALASMPMAWAALETPTPKVGWGRPSSSNRQSPGGSLARSRVWGSSPQSRAASAGVPGSPEVAGPLVSVFSSWEGVGQGRQEARPRLSRPDFSKRSPCSAAPPACVLLLPRGWISVKYPRNAPEAASPQPQGALWPREGGALKQAVSLWLPGDSESPRLAVLGGGGLRRRVAAPAGTVALGRPSARSRSCTCQRRRPPPAP